MFALVAEEGDMLYSFIWAGSRRIHLMDQVDAKYVLVERRLPIGQNRQLRFLFLFHHFGSH